MFLDSKREDKRRKIIVRIKEMEGVTEREDGGGKRLNESSKREYIKIRLLKKIIEPH
jgi:hypothetical protein